MKLSHHARIRMRQRSEYGKKQEQNQFFREALKNGKDYRRIKDEKIKEYLKKNISPKNKALVRVYNNYVLFYSKNSKQLYTMYKLPDELLEERDE